MRQDHRGVWYAQPYLGQTPDGRQIRPKRSFPDAATRAQAQELANTWMSCLSSDGQVRSTLIVDMLWDYIADRQAKGASPYTVKRWKLFTRTYVGEYLRGRVAKDLTPMDMNNFERKLLLPKEKRGRALSRNTVDSVHYFLRGAYNYWVKAGVCETNPMFYAEKPKLEHHEAVAIDEWDFPALDAAIAEAMHPKDPDQQAQREAAYAFAAWLALHTGMRVGEVCAMRRRDVSKRQGFAHVCGKVVDLEGGGVERVDVTKGRKSRNVSLTEREMATILGFVEFQDSFSAGFTPSSPLVSVDGSYMSPTTVSKAFRRMRDRCGLPRECTFHSLRHTHATWLLANGASLKDIADRLGHAQESTTLRLYAHAMPGRDRKAAEMFDGFTDELRNGV